MKVPWSGDGFAFGLHSQPTILDAATRSPLIEGAPWTPSQVAVALPSILPSLQGFEDALPWLMRVRRQQLGNLYGVERRTLAQIVARDEQGEAVLDCRVAAQATDIDG